MGGERFCILVDCFRRNISIAEVLFGSKVVLVRLVLGRFVLEH